MKRRGAIALWGGVVVAHVVVVLVVVVWPAWRKPPKQVPAPMEFEFAVVQPEPSRAAIVPRVQQPEIPPEPRPVKRRRPVIESGRRMQRPTDAATPKAVEPPSEAQIREMLALKAAAPRRAPSPPNDDRAFAALVRDTMYRAWVQPSSGAPDGLVVRVTIRLSGTDSVAAATMTRLSGNATMDESVETALRAVKRIPGLSADYVRRNPSLTIDFELASGH